MSSREYSGGVGAPLLSGGGGAAGGGGVGQGGLARGQTDAFQLVQRGLKALEGPWEPLGAAAAEKVQVQQGGVAAVQLQQAVGRLVGHGQNAAGDQSLRHGGVPPSFLKSQPGAQSPGRCFSFYPKIRPA